MKAAAWGAELAPGENLKRVQARSVPGWGTRAAGGTTWQENAGQQASPQPLGAPALAEHECHSILQAAQLQNKVRKLTVPIDCSPLLPVRRARSSFSYYEVWRVLHQLRNTAIPASI